MVQYHGEERRGRKVQCVIPYTYETPEDGWGVRHIRVGEILSADDPATVGRFPSHLGPVSTMPPPRHGRRLLLVGGVVVWVGCNVWGAGLEPDGANTAAQSFVGSIGLVFCLLLLLMLLLATTTRLTDSRRRRQANRDAAPATSAKLPAVAADDADRAQGLAQARRDVASALWWYREGCWDTAAVLGGVPTEMIEQMLAISPGKPEAEPEPEPEPEAEPEPAAPDPAASPPPVATPQQPVIFGRDIQAAHLGDPPTVERTRWAFTERRRGRPAGLTQPCPMCGAPFVFAHEPVTATTLQGRNHVIPGPITAPPSHRNRAVDRWSCLRPDGTARGVVMVDPERGHLVVRPRPLPGDDQQALARTQQIVRDMEELTNMFTGRVPTWAAAWFDTLRAEFERIEPMVRRAQRPPARPTPTLCTAPAICQPVYCPDGGALLGYVHTSVMATVLFDEHHRRTETQS